MHEQNEGSNACNNDAVIMENTLLLERLETAYKTYKLCECYLHDVTDDYAKQKIGRLRYEFARHELVALLKEASSKGIKWGNSEMLKKFFSPEF